MTNKETKKMPVPWLLILCVVLFLGMLCWKHDSMEPIPGGESEQLETEEEQSVESTGTEPLQESSNNGDTPEEETGGMESIDLQIRHILDSWTLEQKVAQLFFVIPESLDSRFAVTAVTPQLQEVYGTYPVGGIIMMQKNLTDREQTKQLLENLQKLSMDIVQVPIFLGIDEEGGTVARIAGNEAYGIKNVGSMADIGALGDTGEAYKAGETIGGYLKELGFNVDFAPVVDVWTNQENSLFKRRSFGTDVTIVTDMSVAFTRGLEGQGVYSCAKHFPGHGDTREDSHEGFAYCNKTLDELRQLELIPFKAQIMEGVSFIMVGHISLPNILEDHTPCTLSRAVVTGLLREELGYEGIIITDSLRMGAITDYYTSGEAAVMALQAGVDVLLMPKDFQTAYDAVLEAVEVGEISKERLEQSLIRILRVKLEELPKNREKK